MHRIMLTKQPAQPLPNNDFDKDFPSFTSFERGHLALSYGYSHGCDCANLLVDND